MVIRIPAASLWLCLWPLATAAPTAGCDSDVSSTPSTSAPGPVPSIRTLSNRADLISGDDALVEIELPRGATFDQLHVRLGEKDVTAKFAARDDGRILGLVDGLAGGANQLSADVGTGRGAYLIVTNHKIGGPVFSGPQVTPFVCATPTGSAEAGNTPRTNASGLSTAATDDQCNIAGEARLFYRTSGACNPNVQVANPDPVPGTASPDACFKLYNPAAPPGDVMMITSDTGVAMPYIVRVERGTVNRGIYDIAVLFDPSKDDVKTGWKPTAPQPQWNGKVVYSFGASAGQPRLQFHSEQSWADDAALRRGFLVAVNSMTDSLYNSNRVVGAETLMMMKERIIDTYGEVRYVMGNGCSGGSIGQLTAASIYPGLIDGIQPTCTYPDAETTGMEVLDCALLVHFYNSQAWKDLMAGKTQAEIDARKDAINGHLDPTGCHAWVELFADIGKPGNFTRTKVNDTTGETSPDPLGPTNNCMLPASMVYDPETNPNGVRCTGADHAVSIFGRVAGGIRAGTTNDNTGVQYGLEAFRAQQISFDEFLALNKFIGGFDADGNFSTDRSEADAAALATAYRAGIVSDGAHLAKLPIIDLRGYDDSRRDAAFGIHHEWRSFALRARLDAANGNHANYVMWQYGDTPFFVAPPATTLQSFVLMDLWLTAIKADPSAAPLEAKVASNRPVGAFDFCFLSNDTPPFTKQITDRTLCDADPVLKPHRSPRQVAGGPLVENVLKCQLRALNRADYNPVVLTDEQIAKLVELFPEGVCDYSRPGVGQQPAVGPLDFSAGPGGVPLPAPPQNHAF